MGDAAIKYRIYETCGDGSLKFHRKGTCAAFVPVVKNDPKSSFQLEDHVTLDMGDAQIMLDLDEFKRFAKRVLGGKKYKDNVVELKVIQGDKNG